MAERALELVLPWPHKDLSPNARPKWRDKARAVKNARHTAMLLAFRAGWKGMPLPEGRLILWIDCYQAPGKKLPDDDNMVGRCKAYRDGIAQLLGIDDGRFTSRPRVHDERRPRGQVVIRITGEEQDYRMGNRNG
ncbi:hypothetical protein [Stenotrophomonas bentonitica]|uniref:hypothetical protein n=1 Tax=Stenotrophomonas bentonitica TaxID=1450134 RepID=UPI00345E5138